MQIEALRSSRKKMRRLVLALCVPICIAAGFSDGLAATVPYGVIEIGAKGIKQSLFDMDRASQDPACAQEGDAYLKCIDPKSLAQTNCNTIKDPQFACTLPAVQQYWEDFKTKYSLPPSHIYIVGSSSFNLDTQRDLLVGQIKTAVKDLANPIEFVSVDQEATFALKGVLGMLPDKVRKMRSTQAATIDIGSGNVKGAYQSSDGGNDRVVIFGVDYGTKVATDAILAMQKDGTLKAAGDTWRTTVFVPKLRTEIENKDGISNRNRVYLTGGIVWALAVLSHPEDSTKFFRIPPHTIDEMLARASAPDAQVKLCGDSRKQAYPEIAKVCDTFSANQLFGGFEVLKGLSDQLNFIGAQKNVFFFRDALYAWPLGYVRTKLGYVTRKPTKRLVGSPRRFVG